MNTSSKSSCFIVRMLVTAVLFGASASAFADVGTDWNVAMTSYSESLPPPGMPPFVESRVYAMTHIAMLRAITGNDAAAQSFNKIAAVAQAAHDVLVNQFPGGAPTFDNLLASQLGAIPDSAAKQRGIRLGAVAAAGQLAFRANDGSANAEGPYTPGKQPGDYQFTPPFDGPPFNGYAAVPKWGEVRPFAEQGKPVPCTAAIFRPRSRYTFDFNDVKRSAHKIVRAARPIRQTSRCFGMRIHHSAGTASRACLSPSKITPCSSMPAFRCAQRRLG